MGWFFKWWRQLPKGIVILDLRPGYEPFFEWVADDDEIIWDWPHVPECAKFELPSQSAVSLFSQAQRDLVFSKSPWPIVPAP